MKQCNSLYKIFCDEYDDAFDCMKKQKNIEGNIIDPYSYHLGRLHEIEKIIRLSNFRGDKEETGHTKK